MLERERSRVKSMGKIPCEALSERAIVIIPGLEHY